MLFQIKFHHSEEAQYVVACRKFWPWIDIIGGEDFKVIITWHFKTGFTNSSKTHFDLY